MPKTTYLADAILSHIARDATFAKPTTLYISLHTDSPGVSGSLADELAIGVGGYSRASITVDDDNWSAPATAGSYREVMNDSTVSFGTASSNLGTVTHLGINDAATAGNMLYYEALDTPRTISTSDPIEIPAGSLRLSEG